MVDTASLIERRRQIFLNSPHLETISDSIASFKTDVPAPLKSCKINFSPVQEGSGDPSPDNVRPISGWDGVTVTRCGKNWLNTQDVKSYTIDSENTTRFGCTFSKTGSYAITCFDTSGSSYIFAKIRYQDGTFSEPDKIINNKIIAPAVFTIQQGQTLIVYNGSAAGTKSSTIDKFVNCECIVVYDDTIPTAYEPYTGTSITIPFPQTIYGGYADLVKGEVIETVGSDGQPITPQAHTITPEIIKTLKGVNNIWSNANGNIEVKFWKH